MIAYFQFVLGINKTPHGTFLHIHIIFFTTNPPKMSKNQKTGGLEEAKSYMRDKEIPQLFEVKFN